MLNLMVFRTFLVVALALTAAFPALAWDDTGHKIVAYVAWKQMSPAAREKAVKLLMSAPEDTQIQTLYPTPPDLGFTTYPPGARSRASKQRDFFMIASYWADIIRDRDYPVRYKYHRSTWHYLNVFWKIEDGAIRTFPELQVDKENAVERLHHFDKVLRSGAPDSEKGVALAWVLHIAGDIHQPLHASGRVTDLEPKGDQGGNLFSLSPPDAKRKENLHWLWDSLVVRTIPRRADASDAEYLLPIAESAMRKYPLKNARLYLRAGDFDEWHQESYREASSRVFPKSLKRGQMPSRAYMKRAFGIAEARLVMAGYRLGAWLEDVLGAEPVAMADTANKIPCRIIRVVDYPVSKTNDGKAKPTISLLDLCPPNKGMVARPMYPFFVGGRSLMFEYDIVSTFGSEKEARDYAAANGIADISF